MNTLRSWVDQLVSNHLLRVSLLCGLVIVSALLAGLAIRRVARRRAAAYTDPIATHWSHVLLAMVADLRAWVMLVAAVYLSAQGLGLAPRVQHGLRLALALALAYQLLVASRHIVDYLVEAMVNARKDEAGRPDPAIRSASGIIRFMAMVTLGAILLLLLLSNIGIEITPLITGLGIGGVAVALAAQSILSDLFGSLTILFDRPFLVGDFIIVGDKMGTVENIGVKTTRLRSLSGEQLIFSNATLLSEKIQNYQRMQERRIAQVLSVTYETPVEKLRCIPDIIREAVAQQPLTRLDRAHLRSFGAYSLDYEFVFFVETPDYNQYMDVQQSINFFILERFLAAGIEFAYPTQRAIQNPEPVAPTAPEQPEAR